MVDIEESTHAPARRQHARGTAAKVFITINDVRHVAVNWSPGGFIIDNVQSAHGVGDEIVGTIQIDGVPEGGSFRAEITRIDQAGLIAAKFSELGSTEFIELSSLVETTAGGM